MPTKWCPRCKGNFNTDLFNKNKGRFDGLQPYCRACDKLKEAKRRADRKSGASAARPRRKAPTCVLNPDEAPEKVPMFSGLKRLAQDTGVEAFLAGKRRTTWTI